MRILAALTFLCLLAAGSAASIQTQTFTLSGTVVDPAGTPLPGVTVELRQGDAVRQKTVSNPAGEWRFDKVSPGGYGVRFTLAGFVTTEHRLEVRDAAPAALTAVLRVGALSETVVVESPSEPVRVGGMYRPGGVVGGVVGGVATPPPAGELQYRAMHELLRHPETATYDPIAENRFRRVADHPLSTFSIDVDTASYTNVRRFLNEGRLPPPDAVRVEEMINYFKYDYALPRGKDPVAITTEVGAAPWNPRHRLALVGIRAAPIELERTPPRNLTFLLDVSGSMAPPNRLPLVKTAMKMLVDTLRPEDRVAIVVYAGATGVALEADQRGPEGEDQRGDRGAARIGVHARIRRDPARVPDRRRELHQGGHQPRHPRDRRRLQRRRHEPRGADAADRGAARHGDLPLGPRRGGLQPHGRHDADAGAEGERQPRLPRLDPGGAPRARPRGGRDARHRREGREGAGRVQPAVRAGVPAGRLREPDAEEGGLQRRPQGRRRDGRRATWSPRCTRSCRRVSTRRGCRSAALPGSGAAGAARVRQHDRADEREGPVQGEPEGPGMSAG
jgi:hypothetical protein